MKIAVIGNGIVGRMVSKYLISNGIEIDLISVNSAKHKEIAKTKLSYKVNYSSKNNYSKSPKFNRKDFLLAKTKSDSILLKNNYNFLGLELSTSFGLANFWGANIAADENKILIDNLRLTKEESSLLLKEIPILDVQKHYNNHNKIPTNSDDTQIYSSKLAVWRDKCEPCGECNLHCGAIYGNHFEEIESDKFNLIDGYVEKIFQGSLQNQVNILIHINKQILTYTYDFVVVAC